MKYIGYIVGILLFLAIIFGGNMLNLWTISFFAPKYENVRREVFENTQSYIEGKRQSLTKYYDEFSYAERDEKLAIRKLVMQDFSNFNIDHLNTTQYGWYKEIVNYK